MQNKKSPKADIGRNSSLYFAVGLALMMFLSYGTINYKVYDKDALGLDKVSMDALDEEEVPITEQVKPPTILHPPFFLFFFGDIFLVFFTSNSFLHFVS